LQIKKIKNWIVKFNDLLTDNLLLNGDGKGVVISRLTTKSNSPSNIHFNKLTLTNTLFCICWNCDKLGNGDSKHTLFLCSAICIFYVSVFDVRQYSVCLWFILGELEKKFVHMSLKPSLVSIFKTAWHKKLKETSTNEN
jgi:hypothetical protein